MTWITWSETPATGHSGMDQGHQKLVARINQLADAMENKQPREFCSNALDQLILAVRIHFLAEDQLMDRIHYPQAKEHKALHATLVRDAIAFKAAYDAGEDAEPAILRGILDSWLERDLITADKALADFVARPD
jgi:hemerythrin-like metal-binding protein